MSPETVLFGLLFAGAALIPDPGAQELPVETDRLAEVAPHPPAGALETGLGGQEARHYAAAIAAIRAGKNPDALPFLRDARALAYRAYQQGPTPRVLAYRHFVRLLYVEEQQVELTEIDRQLVRQRDAQFAEDKMVLLHERALLLHNQFLAVRAFTGEADSRLLIRALSIYEEVLGRPSPLKVTVQIGYAALLGERGDRRAAQTAFQRVPQDELKNERFDLSVAYYYLAVGDRRRALSRLEEASHRDSWDHPGSTPDGRSVRAMVYRMNDFDRLRDDPRFVELVTRPEERSR